MEFSYQIEKKNNANNPRAAAPTGKDYEELGCWETEMGSVCS